MRTTLVLSLLAAALALSAIAAVLIGSVSIAPTEVVSALLGSGNVNGTIIRELRLPRVLGAALVGGSLAAAGALLQGLLRNPLADPFVTGTSAGATLAAVIAIALRAAAPIVPGAAVLGALAAGLLLSRRAPLRGPPTGRAGPLRGALPPAFS